MECSICLDTLDNHLSEKSSLLHNKNNIKNSQKYVQTLDCGHTFHKKCINDWFKSNESCPYCRKFFKNKFECRIKEDGNFFSYPAILILDTNDKIKEMTIIFKNKFLKKYDLIFNNFNIISVKNNQQNKLILKCFKKLYEETTNFDIFIKKMSYREHIYESLNKMLKNNHISLSDITPSIIDEEEENVNNFNDNKIPTSISKQSIKIISSSSNSSTSSISSNSSKLSNDSFNTLTNGYQLQNVITI